MAIWSKVIIAIIVLRSTTFIFCQLLIKLIVFQYDTDLHIFFNNIELISLTLLCLSTLNRINYCLLREIFSLFNSENCWLLPSFNSLTDCNQNVHSNNRSICLTCQLFLYKKHHFYSFRRVITVWETKHVTNSLLLWHNDFDDRSRKLTVVNPLVQNWQLYNTCMCTSCCQVLIQRENN